MLDLSKEYGLVLEGGGARGAYQIGVWKALRECGVKIKGVAGVSVGALNGALICMGDFDKAIEIWENITYSSIMKVDDEEMDKLVRGALKEIDFKSITKSSAKVIATGGFDITPLKELIDHSIDETVIKNSDIEFIMGTFLVNSMKEIEISAKNAEPGYLKDYLMASSYLPVFKNEKLHGKFYLDGGMLNNVPIDMLIERGYKDIIVVRIYGIGLEKKVKIPEDVNVIEIAPKENLCNILEFNRKKSVRNIQLGYLDACRLLQDLKGRSYYIRTELSEGEYFQKFMSTNVKRFEEYRLFKIDTEKENDYRVIYEELLPRFAESLKLSKNWTYCELYIAILERLARVLRIRRFNIYAENQLVDLMRYKISKKLITNMNGNPYIEMAFQLLGIR